MCKDTRPYGTRVQVVSGHVRCLDCYVWSRDLRSNGKWYMQQLVTLSRVCHRSVESWWIARRWISLSTDLLHILGTSWSLALSGLALIRVETFRLFPVCKRSLLERIHVWKRYCSYLWESGQARRAPMCLNAWDEANPESASLPYSTWEGSKKKKHEQKTIGKVNNCSVQP